MVVHVRDVITCFKFGDDRLRGLASAEGQILPFPIDFDGRPYNTLTLPCERVINVKKLTSLKLIVRMMGYHSTKTAKIFWVTLDVAMHGAAYGRPMRSPI